MTRDKVALTIEEAMRVDNTKHQMDKLGQTSLNKVDGVNHPTHYNQGNIETIDYIESCGMGEDFCAANIIKYISRYKHKGTPLKDLYKVKWYIERLINYYESNTKK